MLPKGIYSAGSFVAASIIYLISGLTRGFEKLSFGVVTAMFLATATIIGEVNELTGTIGTSVRTSGSRTIANSYIRSGKRAPDHIAKQVAQDEGKTLEQYRKEEDNEIKKNKNSLLEKLMSWVEYTYGNILEKTGYSLNFFSTLTGVLLISIVLVLLIKWIAI